MLREGSRNPTTRDGRHRGTLEQRRQFRAISAAAAVERAAGRVLLQSSMYPRRFIVLAAVACAACSAATPAGDDPNETPNLTTTSNKGGAKKDPGSSGSSGSSGSTSGDASETTDANADPPDASVEPAPGASIDACSVPGMTTAVFEPYGSISAMDEGATRAMALPFAFTFLGASQTHFWVTTNGELGFGTSVAPPSFGDVSCPLADATITSPMVFAYAGDLRLNLPGGAVCIATTGAAPNRQLVVTWKDLAFYELSNGGDSHLTFSAVLDEATHAIDLVVQSVRVYSPYLPPEEFEKGTRSVLGLQSGANAVTCSCRDGNAPEGTRFHYAP
jgi:hypothetical protein